MLSCPGKHLIVFGLLDLFLAKVIISKKTEHKQNYIFLC